MQIEDIKKTFLNYCIENNFQKNTNQVKIIDELIQFYKKEKSFKNFFINLFSNQSNKLSFYLYGDVGVGKTMLLDFFYKYLNVHKKRIHFNEFMINFHDFCHSHKNENSLESFVKKLKKECQTLYLDEFQVTNIVDAMILGRLFKSMFRENIRILITSNTKINELYKDGLQQEQFLPFIKIIKKYSIEMELNIDEDYRKLGVNSLNRFFYPLNAESTFKLNQIFRKITKYKQLTIKKIFVKGREYKIENYYEKIAKFEFNNLFELNLGAEDYIQISNHCDFITIENIPIFTNENINKQQRFITFIDIIYEKKISMMVTSETNLENLDQSINLKKPFKRTISRIYELTNKNFFSNVSNDNAENNNIVKVE